MAESKDDKIGRLMMEYASITQDKYTPRKDRLRLIEIKTELERLVHGPKTTLDKKKGGAVMKKRGGTFKGTF